MRARSVGQVAFIALVSAGVLSACKAKLKSTPETKALVSVAPKWYSSPPRSDDAFFGVATAESKDMQVSVDKAQAAARASLAQQMETKFSGLQKRFSEEVGQSGSAEFLDQFTSAYKLVTSQELTGTRVKEQETLPGEGIYRTFVMMELPIGPANKALRDKLASQQALYTRFRATQAFKDLNEEIEKYETSNKKQVPE